MKKYISKIYHEISYRSFSIFTILFFIIISSLFLSYENFIIFLSSLFVFVSIIILLRLMLYKIVNIKKYSILNLIFFLVLLLLLVIFLFGCIYHYFNDQKTNYLMFFSNGNHVDNFFDAIYFSAVTFFAIGYGDIIPQGMFKIVAIIEVILMVLMNIVFIGVIANFVVQHKIKEKRLEQIQKKIEEEINVIKKSNIIN